MSRPPLSKTLDKNYMNLLEVYVMLKTFCVGNTAWVGELQTKEVTGADGKPFTSQSIMFRIATKRDYYITRTVNGEQLRERPTDFFSCKATGALAKLIADYASDKKEDGKLVSRLVELSGHMETYKSKRIEKKVHQFQIGDDLCEAEIEHEVETVEHIFMVDSLNFLDSNKSEGAKPVATKISGPIPVRVVKPVAQAETPKAEEKSAPVAVEEEKTQAPTNPTPVPDFSDIELPEDLLDDDYPC